MNKKINIPNPNKISVTEKDFLSNTEILLDKKDDKFRGRMISMSDSFFKELNEYLKNNPTEGNRSSFIVRVVAKYIKENKDNV